MQSTISFNDRGKLPDEFLYTFDRYLELSHGQGIRSIEDAPNNESGYVAIYDDRSEKMNGLVRKISTVFGNENATKQIGAELMRTSNVSSRNLGNLIHRHIYHQIECIAENKKCTCKRRTPDKPNALAAQMLHSVLSKGYTPVHSEMPIVSHELNIATRIDLLCINHTSPNDFVLISWKTGNAAIQDKRESGPRFGFPFKDIVDNQYNRHQMQLLFEYLILAYDYQIHVVDAFIVYGGNDVVFKKAANWWWNNESLQLLAWNEAVKNNSCDKILNKL